VQCLVDLNAHSLLSESLALGHVKEFAHTSKALAPIAPIFFPEIVNVL